MNMGKNCAFDGRPGVTSDVIFGGVKYIHNFCFVVGLIDFHGNTATILALDVQLCDIPCCAVKHRPCTAGKQAKRLLTSRVLCKIVYYCV